MKVLWESCECSVLLIAHKKRTLDNRYGMNDSHTKDERIPTNLHALGSSVLET